MVLDFASCTNPGGGARSNQQGTQEEALCRESTLLSGLEALMDQGKYPIPHEGYALVEGVLVYRYQDFSLRDTPFYCDVIASDMGNLEGVGQAKLERVVKGKLDVVLDAFLERKGAQTLVLGAWGSMISSQTVRSQCLRYLLLELC